MSDKIELMRLCDVLQSNFSCLSQSESRTQPCHVRINILTSVLCQFEACAIIWRQAVVELPASRRQDNLPTATRGQII